MALSCGAKCAKGVLIAFNLVFWLSGCALIAFGIYILIEEEKAMLFRLFQIDENYALIQYLAFAFIGIGGLVFIVGFFGCCGAIQENKCMLVMYFICLFLILGAELAVGILAAIFQEKVIPEMEQDLTRTLHSKYGTDTPMTESIDIAQMKFKCCGVKDYKDYEDTAWKRQMGKSVLVPKSCCVLSNFGHPDAYRLPMPANSSLCQSADSRLSSQSRHQEGCQKKLEIFIREESTLFIAIGCGITALEIFGMIFSICLCKEI